MSESLEITFCDRIRMAWSSFKDWLFFLTRKTVYVSSTPTKGQYADLGSALDALPVRGGTVKVLAGTYEINQPIELPDKPMRIRGGHFRLRGGPAFEVGKGYVSLRGCVFDGTMDFGHQKPPATLFVLNPPTSESLALQSYIDLQIVAGRLEQAGDRRADAVRDLMDVFWDSLRDDEREWLSKRR